MTEREPEWESLAVGSSGRVCIDLNESVTEVPRFEMLLETPQLDLRFAIGSPGQFVKLHSFMQNETSEKYTMGTFANTPVEMFRDSKSDSRFFITVSQSDGGLYFSLTDSLLTDFVAALGDAIDDMNQ